MSYATLQSLKERLGSSVSPPGVYQQVTDRVLAKIGNDAVGQSLIDEADGFVDQRLAGVTRTPIDTSGQASLAAFLSDCVLTIAAYNAWARSITKKIPPDVESDYKRIVSTLDAIAKGEGRLPSSGALPSPTSTGVMAEVFGYPQIFTREGTRGL